MRSTVDVKARFDAFFEENWSDVLAYARRRTPTVDDAHDVAAETFTVAWRRFDEIPPDRPVPWLFRTAANVLANQRRSDARRLRLVERVTHEKPTVTSPAADRVVDDAPIFAALTWLSDEQRELLMLAAWDGLDNGAIAEVLQISPNAVASRLRRARQRFEEAIAVEETP